MFIFVQEPINNLYIEKSENQFVIMSNSGNEEPEESITPKDKLIYLAIRRYMNSKTKEAFPSYEKLKEDLGVSPRTIKKCVDNLVNAGYLKVNKRGAGFVYKFNDKNKFEPFSYEFLDNKELSFTEKSYIVATQQFMFKDADGNGLVKYSNNQLAKMINMSPQTIGRCNDSLVSKGKLDILDDNSKTFYLRELDQMFIWKLKEHDEKINYLQEREVKHESEISELKREIELLKKRVEN